MNLAEKEAAVAELSGDFAGASAAFLVGFQGTKCSELTNLRRKLGTSGAKLSVVKNTLAKRAIQGTSAAGLNDLFVGPTAVIWSKEPVTPAKVLTEFAKDIEALKIKGGVVDGAVIGVKDIEALSKLPSREELLSKLLALINAPATRLLQTVNAPASSLARVLGAWRGELEKNGQ